MKNNRQVGLDGRIFVSSCMRRGTFFVFILMIYGLMTAAADILKLTGASGVAMGSFTTTLLIYDFIVSLMLVVVVFYAYFLECGADVPVLKEKPLVIFGFFRIGYYILLSYYLCYHMLYCAVNRDTVPVSLSFFYAVYLVLIMLLILANCYIFNSITRNIIRRSYSRSFQRLAFCGIGVQIILPIAYIIVRVNMKNIGDEYFTDALCDLIRLCICPIMLTSVWFLFLHGKEQVTDIYKEVDTALVNKRYQITYSTDSGKKSGRGGGKASATILPAPAENPAIAAPKSAAVIQRALPASVNAAAASVTAAVIADKAETSPLPAPEANNAVKKNAAPASAEASEKPDTEATPEAQTLPAPSGQADEPVSDEIINEFAAEARRAAAKAAAQSSAAKQQQQRPPHQKPQQQQQPQQNQQRRSGIQQNNAHQGNRSQPVSSNAVPVQEFDPFPAANVPRRTPQQNNNAQRSNSPQSNQQRGNQQRSSQQRNNNQQRSVPQGQQSGAQNSQQRLQHTPNGQHYNRQPQTAQNNSYRGNQQNRSGYPVQNGVGSGGNGSKRSSHR